MATPTGYELLQSRRGRQSAVHTHPPLHIPAQADGGHRDSSPLETTAGGMKAGMLVLRISRENRREDGRGRIIEMNVVVGPRGDDTGAAEPHDIRSSIAVHIGEGAGKFILAGPSARVRTE